MSSQDQTKKLILVIGATGAQGLAVIDALLAPATDGSPSPYRVRALTRNPSGHRAVALASRGVEIAVGMHRLSQELAWRSRPAGSFDDFAKVADALRGCYGAWVNTDGFTVGEEREIYAGMRIFEAAKQTPTLRHYVWSNLDYTFKVCTATLT
jgi:nucleoside-diphosphate-sugar epimerase